HLWRDARPRRSRHPDLLRGLPPQPFACDRRRPWSDDVQLFDIRGRFTCTGPRRTGGRRAARFQLEHKPGWCVGLPVRLGRCTMSWSPGRVPYGADQTVYIVVDTFGAAGASSREMEIERADLEAVISDLLTGQFNAPVRIVAFNTLEHWAED